MIRWKRNWKEGGRQLFDKRLRKHKDIKESEKCGRYGMMGDKMWGRRTGDSIISMSTTYVTSVTMALTHEEHYFILHSKCIFKFCLSKLLLSQTISIQYIKYNLFVSVYVTIYIWHTKSTYSYTHASIHIHAHIYI